MDRLTEIAQFSSSIFISSKSQAWSLFTVSLTFFILGGMGGGGAEDDAGGTMMLFDSALLVGVVDGRGPKMDSVGSSSGGRKGAQDCEYSLFMSFRHIVHVVLH